MERLLAARHPTHGRVLTATYTGDADKAFLESWADRAKAASKFMWELTEGQLYVKEITVTDRGGPADVTIINKGSMKIRMGAHAEAGPDTITAPGQILAYTSFHELIHFKYARPDHCTNCRHCIMSSDPTASQICDDAAARNQGNHQGSVAGVEWRMVGSADPPRRTSTHRSTMDPPILGSTLLGVVTAIVLLMPHVVAMGGGGFSMEATPLLDRFVLSLTGKRRPAVAFVPTASGDSRDYCARFLRAFRRLGAKGSILSLFRRDEKDLRRTVLAKDVVYVGGGNTHNMLLLWRDWGLDRILRDAYERGVVMAGLSAGSICWFEEGLTDSFGMPVRPMKCLGFLKGSHCPHYDGEAFRRRIYRDAIAAGRMKPGWAADDGAALHFVDGRLKQVVSSRRKARVYAVSPSGSREIVSRYLGRTR